MGKNSKAVKSEGKAVKHRGQFKKGHDPRRHMKGTKSKGRLAFNKELRELLVEEGEQLQKGTIGEKTFKLKKVEWLVKSVWGKAIQGEAWAVNFIAERVEGKITQPVDHSGKVDHAIFMMPRPNKKDAD